MGSGFGSPGGIQFFGVAVTVKQRVNLMIVIG